MFRVFIVMLNVIAHLIGINLNKKPLSISGKGLSLFSEVILDINFGRNLLRYFLKGRQFLLKLIPGKSFTLQ